MGFSPEAVFHCYVVCEVSRTNYLHQEITTSDENKQVKVALILYSFIGEMPRSDLGSDIGCTD
jgi:hypothetical protein